METERRMRATETYGSNILYDIVTAVNNTGVHKRSRIPRLLRTSSDRSAGAACSGASGPSARDDNDDGISQMPMDDYDECSD